uniref:Charged multivesicular body protein 4b n=1 Tax=Strigamia maritima TaxID=126957 RepID=T1J526_STRMM
MSFFGKVFGGGKQKDKTPSTGEAIQKLRETESMLCKKQEYLEKKIEYELAVAKKNGTKNKRAALQALKKKKRFEKQLQQIDGTLSTIEFQREALENANTNTEVLKIMGFAARALKAAHQNMDVDEVHDLMDEVAEQQDIAKEISDVISNPIGFQNDIDEDELEKELEELEQEELDEKLLDVGGPSVDELPSPPTAEPRKPAAVARSKPEDDKELAELEQWAS